MVARVKPHRFSGPVRVPASKSHTIRRLLIAALGAGVSEIEYPLDSLDTRSCLAVCRALGAAVDETRAPDASCPNPPDARGDRLVRWTIRGRAGPGTPAAAGPAPAVPGPASATPAAPSITPGPASSAAPGPASAATPGPSPFAAPEPAPSAAAGPAPASSPAAIPTVNVGNSGTTLFLALAAAGLFPGPLRFDGDRQIRRRSAAPLLAALEGLGVYSESEGGRAPITVRGPWKGGLVSIECPTSQYLSALLLAAPLAPPGTLTELRVPLLNERPYVDMTLAYLDAQGVPCERAGDYSWFRLPGGRSYRPMPGPVPADFSSAAFPAAAAAISGGPVELAGLDPEDTQGDKVFFTILGAMGCEVRWRESPVPRPGDPGPGGAESRRPRSPPGVPPGPVLRIARTGPLRGGEFDLNDSPDLLPACAVTAAFARGDTALVNAAHARLKETDRIAVMAAELGKLGVRTTERPDGLIIHGTGEAPRGGRINGHGDHRVVMAFAAAALAAAGPIEIEGAESAAVTYPGFLELLNAEVY